MKYKTLVATITIAVALALPGCSSKREPTLAPHEVQADKKVREKYGSSLAELPVVKLIAISPHNTDIENEYETAFSLYHAVEYGEKVKIEWRDVGGGALRYCTTCERFIKTAIAPESISSGAEGNTTSKKWPKRASFNR